MMSRGGCHHRDRCFLPQGWLCRVGLLTVVLLGLLFHPTHGHDLTAQQQLGKLLFFDKNLSNPPGQACASCHAPEVGFTGPDSNTNLATGVYPGAAPGRFGNRKPPSVAYASFSPKRTYKKEDETWEGGQFWDGRADDLIAQAKGPFLNPLEMNNASSGDVVEKVRQSRYRALFEQVYGRDALNPQDADRAFDRIAQAIAAYESSSEVNSFSSKYDAYLVGQATLTPSEKRGLELYAGKANCASCHPHQPDSSGAPPLFTDFTYDNLGVPRNSNNPFYRAAVAVNPDGAKFRDLGLGGSLKDDAQAGRFKVPTLRNVAKRPNTNFVKSYFHNGSLKSLKEVVRFYNRRDTSPKEFAAADVQETINHEELGKLGMTDAEEDDVVAFLETLSDGYAAPKRPGPLTGPTDSGSPRNRDHFGGARDILRVEKFRRESLLQASPERTPRR